ncbi:protein NONRESPONDING TO OXYLIPINS 2, mitochondrial isoform X1 [Typha angustifolia]|uniref:protein NONRESPONDING TO OXYLIPINS 2, mitochondrial isoform X1 n=1 Tax=Typha angustifolia TaxID=59011 RepID=UPI003C2BD6E4
MASLRAAATVAASAARSAALRSKTLLPKPSPSSGRATPLVRRSIAALGSVESLMPLHSAIASARLKSFIAVDSSCWSWLSQGRALPL